MTTGPEHYRRAEELVAQVEATAKDEDPDVLWLTLKVAEIHADLAQVAANAIKLQNPEDTAAWRIVCGVSKPKPKDP